MLRPSARLLLVLGMVALVAGLPVLVHRLVYTHGKRLREVDAGRVYRSGQLSAEGFADAIRTYGLRTVLNLQDDNLDPALPQGFLDRRTTRESEVCARLGVRYRVISPDLLSVRDPDRRPAAVDEFLKIMDDPDTYPVLFHCKAGLHRTGILAAVYRMEYNGWPLHDAFQELRAHGFGDRACTAANEYVRQYVLTYQPRKVRSEKSEVRSPRSDF